MITCSTLQETRRILDLLPAVRRAVGIGGARSRAGLGAAAQRCEVTPDRYSLSRTLDPFASEVVLGWLCAARVGPTADDDIAAVEGWLGRAACAHLQAARQIAFWPVGTAIGVGPNVDHFVGRRPYVCKGVVVDEGSRAGHPGDGH